jgi:membrane fusion protein, multidrug efflux system
MKTTRILLPWLLFLISCGNTTDTNNNTAEAVNVTVFKAEKRYYNDVFDYSGTLKPFREANLGATIPGRVEKIHVAIGGFVEKGSLVVEMSAEPMLMAQVEKDAVEKDYLRVKRLREKGSVTQQDYDHVHAKYEASLSKLELFKNNTRIRAPFSGVVVEYLVKEGENFMFSPGLEIGLSHTSGIVRLVQMNPLIVAFQINEKDIPHIKKGMIAEISVDAFANEKISAQIVQVGPMVSSMSRTAEAQVVVPNNDGKFMPGMFTRVKIEIPGDTLVFVPQHVVIQDESGYFVWVVEEGIARKKNVKQVISKNGFAALQNIVEGEKVVVAGISRLNEGISVVE